MEKTEENRWKHIMPDGQKCMRELERGYSNPSDATRDYNGMGHWVCDRCDTILNDEFDDDYN